MSEVVQKKEKKKKRKEKKRKGGISHGHNNHRQILSCTATNMIFSMLAYGRNSTSPKSYNMEIA
jgi:hypothetical protein